MGRIDSLARSYFSNTKIFADVFNTLCFNCRRIIDSERLERVPTEVIAQNFVGEKETFSRDLLMRMTGMKYNESLLVLLGLEHQSYVNYEMPLRCLHYDVLSLMQQCEEISRSRSVATPNSFSLGKLLPGEKITPVITAVVYVGSTPWDGPRTLREMLTKQPTEVESLLFDYKMHLLTPDMINEEMNASFQSELGMVLYYARYFSNRVKMREFLQEKQPKLSREAVEFLNASLNTKIKINTEEATINMCNAWEEQYNAGREEGREEGREDIIIRLVDDLRPHKSDEEICDYLQKVIGISYEQAKAYLVIAHQALQMQKA